MSVDFNALSALTTSALNRFCDDPPGTPDVNGCDAPDQIACSALGVEDHGLSGSIVFGIAFDFALRVGAIVALDPLHRPNLDDLVEEFRGKVRREKYESRPQVSSTVGSA